MLMWYMIDQGVGFDPADLYKAAAVVCAMAAFTSWKLLDWASSEDWW